MSVPTLDCDLGNSRVKWRFGRHSGAGQFDDKDCFRQIGVARVRIASVLSADRTHLWARRCEQAWPGVAIDYPKVAPLANGLVPAYRQPERLGIDRWLGIAAAFRPGEACCVISAGTALTIDFVTRTGEHLGGYIAPGIELGRKALGESTDRVRSTAKSLFEAQLGPGRDTQTCVEHALRLGHVGLIKEALYRYESRHGPVGIVHLTGGNAPWLSGLLERPTQLHENLVLDGLTIVLP